MTERIVIQNFAGIKEIALDLGEINVLIGPQASGKSITAKTIYYFKSFFGDILNAITDNQNKRDLDKHFIDKFNLYFSVQSVENKPYLLRYENNNTFIQIEEFKGKPKLTYSDYYKKSFTFWKSFYRDSLERIDDTTRPGDRLDVVFNLRRAYYSNLAREFGRYSAYDQIFIPAGRSFFAILQSSIFTFLASSNAIDPFLTEFGSYYESMKLAVRRSSSKNDDEKNLQKTIDNLTETILQGTHFVEKGKDFLLTKDGRKIDIAHSSSGQQEMLPLSLILSAIPFVRRYSTLGNAIYIEEPEAHLFPSAQQHIVDLLATIYNNARVPAQFIITTHSPYILAAFNNLLQAGIIQKSSSENELKELETVVPRERILDPSKLRVYSLHDGISENIISAETNLISTSILDEVSDQLAIQFDRLLEIE